MGLRLTSAVSGLWCLPLATSHCSYYLPPTCYYIGESTKKKLYTTHTDVTGPCGRSTWNLSTQPLRNWQGLSKLATVTWKADVQEFDASCQDSYLADGDEHGLRILHAHAYPSNEVIQFCQLLRTSPCTCAQPTFMITRQAEKENSANPNRTNFTELYESVRMWN
jgi:hypothetical protein